MYPNHFNLVILVHPMMSHKSATVNRPKLNYKILKVKKKRTFYNWFQ